MGLSLNPKKLFKKAVNVITHPSRALLALGTAGISEMTNWGEKLQRSGVGRTLDVAGYIAAAAAGGYAALGGAAAAGGTAASAGVGGTAAATGAEAAAAGGGTILGMSPTTVLTAASTGASIISGQLQAREQAKAQKDAQRQAAQAARESEIMRKQALLTSQMSLGQRKNQAAFIADKLRNTNTLGADEEKLGG